jgi:hypothetical protein
MPQPGQQSQVAGLPVFFGADADGFYTTAEFQNVSIYGSPLIVQLNPPVADVHEAGTPALLGLIAALANGAVIQMP